MMRFLMSVGLALTLCVSTSNGQGIYGTWRGMFNVTEMFTGNLTPYGTPPYEPIETILEIHPFDSDLQHFGTISFADDTSGSLPLFGGNIVALSENNGAVSMTLFYPAGGAPFGYGDLTATLTGDLLAGSLIDRAPAPPGYVHFRGPISLARVVPEPSAGFLAAVAAFGTGIWRRRRI